MRGSAAGAVLGRQARLLLRGDTKSAAFHPEADRAFMSIGAPLKTDYRYVCREYTDLTDELKTVWATTPAEADSRFGLMTQPDDYSWLTEKALRGNSRSRSAGPDLPHGLPGLVEGP